MGGRAPTAAFPAPSPATTPLDVVPNRDRYHVFELDGVDFLVAAAPDGGLDPADAYVFDADAGVYSRPAISGSPDLPPGPAPYVAIPWESKFDGDTLYRKEASSKTLRVYLIKAKTAAPLTLDLATVVSLDAATRAVTRETVVVQATSDDPERTTLRIR